jgi:hypothetical protein
MATARSDATSCRCAVISADRGAENRAQTLHGITGLRTDFRQIAKDIIPADFTVIGWPSLPSAAQAMDRLGRSLVGAGTERGNDFKLLSDTQAILAAIVVEAAKSSMLIEFYIWNEGGAP